MNNLERDMTAKLIGRTVRLKTLDTKLSDYYITANPRDLSILQNPSGDDYKWSVFNVLPGLNGRGISFQSAADKNSFIFSSDTRLSIFKVPDGITPADVSQRLYTQWLPIAPRTGETPVDGTRVNYATFLFEPEPRTMMLQQQFYLVNGVSNNSDLAKQDSSWQIIDVTEDDEDWGFIYEWDLINSWDNKSSKPISHNLTYQEGVEISASTSSSIATEIGWSASTEADYFVLKAMFEINFGITVTNTVSDMFTENKTVTSSATIEVPPGKSVSVWHPCMRANTPTATVTARSSRHFVTLDGTDAPTQALPGISESEMRVGFGAN